MLLVYPTSSVLIPVKPHVLQNRLVETVDPGLPMSISGLISSMWRKEPTEARAEFILKAGREKVIHGIEYPGKQTRDRKEYTYPRTNGLGHGKPFKRRIR